MMSKNSKIMWPPIWFLQVSINIRKRNSNLQRQSHVAGMHIGSYRVMGLKISQINSLNLVLRTQASYLDTSLQRTSFTNYNTPDFIARRRSRQFFMKVLS